MTNMTQGIGLAAIVLGLVSGARADIIVSIDDVTAVAPGSTGNALYVRLTNTGPDRVGISGFTFGLSATTPEIIFTRADVSTSPLLSYILGPFSTFEPVMAFP